MSYSPNSETTPSKRHETRNFTRFGMQFRYGLVVDTVPEWEQQTITDAEGVDRIEWIKTGKTKEISYTQFAMVNDDDMCAGGKFIEVYSTPDAPILAITLETNADEYLLLDPCVTQFDPNKGRLNLMPIFNVMRTLRLCKSAVRSIQVPAELLLAAYPGFIISSRMAKYQIKPAVPLAGIDINTLNS